MRVISVVLAGLVASVSPAIGDVMLMNRIGPSASELYVANADGSRERQLLLSASGLRLPRVLSPDGRWIVFTSERDGFGQADIYRVRVRWHRVGAADRQPGARRSGRAVAGRRRSSPSSPRATRTRRTSGSSICARASSAILTASRRCRATRTSRTASSAQRGRLTASGSPSPRTATPSGRATAAARAGSTCRSSASTWSGRTARGLRRLTRAGHLRRRTEVVAGRDARRLLRDPGRADVGGALAGPGPGRRRRRSSRSTSRRARGQITRRVPA